ncbi:hypothetical protein ERJ75_001655900 [Trypanosoma vivax]|uniref:Uncharacterized protein n=1 Tax=Trypanosoma vivax (strain Y486) TaxID=1055687 RepID=G0U9E4_TRYVY|nr:hypothetical protein TRVL_05156 [Trypanosoma vivax]KAH8605124.1 hypothetical protein ERJ75_001655900 [Trypanosoma vivax]CCC54229.1 putative Hypothetical protein [Trypanosoma vivax Y486]
MHRFPAPLLAKIEFVSPKPETPITSKRFKCIPPATLYRRLLKLYTRKFDTDHETIVGAWKQTRYEFWLHRDAPPEEAELHNIRGQQIHDGIRAGLIPLYKNDKTRETFFKYDADTLKAAHNHVDPIDLEEFVRRYRDKMQPEDVEEVRTALKKLNRWKGPDLLRDEDLYSLKQKVRRKSCTDPREE